MARYVYRRYEAKQVFNETLTRTDARLGGLAIQGYPDFEIVNGIYVGVGDMSRATASTGRHFISDEPVFGDSKPQGRYKVYATLRVFDMRGDEYRLDGSYIRGVYIDEIIADENQYPINGRSGGYWYVRGDKYAPYPLIHVDGEWVEPTDGYVKVDGVWRPIAESFVKEDGEWKTLV